MNDRHLASGRDLHRLAGKETPATAIFHKGISEAKLGVEGLAVGERSYQQALAFAHERRHSFFDVA